LCDFPLRRVQPELVLDRIILSGPETLESVGKSRIDLLLRRKCVDRDPQDAYRPFGVGLATGEGKADSAGLPRVFRPRRQSGSLQYGAKSLPIKLFRRKRGIDQAVADGGE